MTRRVIALIVTMFALASFAVALEIPEAVQAPVRGASPSSTPAPAAPAPRMADGHPDLSGVWWSGGDVGGAQFGQSTGARIGGARGTPAPTFPSLYTPEAAALLAPPTQAGTPIPSR